MKRAAFLMALCALPCGAHRLDEYLQATLVTVDSHRLQAEMTLTPGVAVLPFVLREISGSPSDYAEQVLRDLSISIDGRKLTPHLTAVRFPAPAEIQEGRGEIHLSFTADLPAGGRERELRIENRHQNRISAYLVNCLVPKDPHVQIVRQIRNYTQSEYRLEFSDSGGAAAFSGFLWLIPLGLLATGRLWWLYRKADISSPVSLSSSSRAFSSPKAAS